MVVAKKYIFVKPFEGMPTKENVEIVDEKLPPLKDREYLSKAIYISVDSYTRELAQFYKIGDVIPGRQISMILESKSDKYPVGKCVVNNFGWRTHTVAHEDDTDPGGLGSPAVITFGGGLPASLALGVLGVSGHTAYGGLLGVCKPKPGETVIISGATGVVGSTAGQIAKIKGCTVIGITGSDDKTEWLKSLGFDQVVNYKTQDVRKTLREVAPQGIDCYFDNIGGEISSIILEHMNRFGRIAVCGSLAYDQDEHPKASIVQRSMLAHQLVMKGFFVEEFKDEWDEATAEHLKWIQEGKMKYKETVIDGFENTLDALVGTLKGKYVGKIVIKI